MTGVDRDELPDDGRDDGSHFPRRSFLGTRDRMTELGTQSTATHAVQNFTTI